MYRALGLIAIAFSASLVHAAAQQRPESRDFYRKWVEEDVTYIISEEERAVYQKLSTDEERERFIEQFWLRRSRDPRGAGADAREEHYRRIAYANDRYGSGIPGWKTDRGRIYITFGPPDIIEDHPSGGWYYRPAHEGGGATSTYPFQTWTYNYIEGLGDQVEIEFVDPSWSGEYRMALEPWEKDALLHAGFMGPTDAELEGKLSKLDRPYFRPGHARNTLMQRRLGMRAKDKPFERVLQFYRLQQPSPIKYKDLQTLVTTHVTYNQLPFELSYDYLAIGTDQALVPITLELANRHLRFTAQEAGGTYRGTVNIYGVVQSVTGRFITEVEDDLTIEFPAAELQLRSARKSVYQKMLLLPPGRYKLTLAVKDVNSENVGTLETGLIIPSRRTDGLDSSSVILARSLQVLDQVPDVLGPFILGDLKVVPNVTKTFHHGDDMGMYLQVYNAAVDAATQNPAVEVEYQIVRDGKIVKSFLDPKRNSVLNYGDWLLLVRAFDLEDLQAGDYTLVVKVRDQIRKTDLEKQIPFSVM